MTDRNDSGPPGWSALLSTRMRAGGGNRVRRRELGASRAWLPARITNNRRLTKGSPAARVILRGDRRARGNACRNTR